MTLFEEIKVDDTTPAFVDHQALAKWAEDNGIEVLDVAKILARVIDTKSNIGMDFVRNLLDQIGPRVKWPQDLSHIVDEEERYQENLFLMIRSGKITDEALREVVDLARVENRYDSEPMEFDLEMGYAAECAGCGLYWIGTQCGCEQ